MSPRCRDIAERFSELEEVSGNDEPKLNRYRGNVAQILNTREVALNIGQDRWSWIGMHLT